MGIGKRPLLYGSAHSLPLLAPMRQDPLVVPLVVAGLETACRLAPRRDRMPPAGGLAFAAAVRMVHRVHGDAAVMGRLAHPSRAARLTQGDVLVIDVAHLADGRHAVQLHAT